MTAAVVTGRSSPTLARAAVWLLALLIGVGLVWAAGEWAAARESRQQLDALRRSAEIQVLGLRAAATRFEYLPHAIAQHQDVLAVLAAPKDGAARDRANRFLAGVAQRAALSALYVMDEGGSTLAASNWDSLTSFVGHSYRDRPYFVDARNGRTGSFYGVGLTTGIPGYFIAAPVRQEGKGILGVVAAKLSLESIEAAWSLQRDPILLHDARGIVFLGNVPDWQYRSTRPLTVMELEWLRYFKQYGERSHFEPVPWSADRGGGNSGVLLHSTSGPQPRSFLAIEESLPEFGWTLTVTADHRPIVVVRRIAWALTALMLLALLLGVLVWRQRERRFAEQRQARLELERRVHERTRELQDARGYWQAMEDSLLVGLRARDLEGRIVYVNPALCDMLGYTTEELVGRMPPYPYWHPEDLDKHWRDNEAVVTGKAALNGFESRVRHRDGHDVYTMVYTAPLLDASGKQSGWMSSVVDISAQKQAEERQRSQQAQLQKATRLLSLGEMASTLAHELNQPLMALSNFAAAAKAFAEQGPKELLVASLGDISAQATRAGEIVARIRGFVRQRSGQVELCSLAEVIASVQSLIEPERRSRKARLEVTLSPDLPLVRGDRVLLEQVLLNLVLNSLQAAQHLSAPRRVVQIEAARDGDMLVVRVADRGPGVSPEVEAQLFEPFFTSKADGLGLGLNICRTIIEGHGGHLGHENRDGGGALFFFTLPAAP
jgi:two-component system, LuxR family, sensor histidine kinase DctS